MAGQKAKPVVSKTKKDLNVLAAEEMKKTLEEPKTKDKQEYMGLISQRLSVVEKELRDVKNQLEKARKTLTKKDRELEAMRAKMAQGSKPRPVFVKNEEATTAYGSVAPYERRKLKEINELSLSEEEEIAEIEITRTDPELAYELSKSDASQLEKECERLAKKVYEMERFLADYGLVWVGEPEGADEHGVTGIAYSPNFERVLLIIDEMNFLNQQPQIEKTCQGATFKQPETLCLALYKNGMQLEDNPFREYSTQSVMEFFRDLEDGYYPTELKGYYPEGVKFKVIDRRDEEYTPQTEIFSGKGYTLRESLKEGDEIPEQPTLPEQRKNLKAPSEESKTTKKGENKAEKKAEKKAEDKDDKSKKEKPAKDKVKESSKSLLKGSLTSKSNSLKDQKKASEKKETKSLKQQENPTDKKKSKTESKQKENLVSPTTSDSYTPDKSFWINKNPEMKSSVVVDITKNKDEVIQTDDHLTKYMTHSHSSVETSSIGVQTTMTEVGKVKLLQRASASNDKRVSQSIPPQQSPKNSTSISPPRPQRHSPSPPSKLLPPQGISQEPKQVAQKSPPREVVKQASPLPGPSNYSSNPPVTNQQPNITKISYHEAPITMIKMPIYMDDSIDDTKVEDMATVIGKGGSRLLKEFEERRKQRYENRRRKSDISDLVEEAVVDVRKVRHPLKERRYESRELRLSKENQHEKKRRGSAMAQDCVERSGKPIKSPHTIGTTEPATVADIMGRGRRPSYTTEYGAKYNPVATKIEATLGNQSDASAVSQYDDGGDAAEYEHMTMIRPGFKPPEEPIKPTVSTISQVKEKKKGEVKEINPKTSDHQITLKVRDGNDQLIINVYPDDTISRVYSLVDADPETYRLTLRGGSKSSIDLDRNEATFEEYQIDKDTVLTLSKIPSEVVSQFQVTPKPNKELKPHPTIWQVSQSVLTGEKKAKKSVKEVSKEKSPDKKQPSDSGEKKSESQVDASFSNDYSDVTKSQASVGSE